MSSAAKERTRFAKMLKDNRLFPRKSRKVALEKMVEGKVDIGFYLALTETDDDEVIQGFEKRANSDGESTPSRRGSVASSGSTDHCLL
jgi:hypothetical protein